MSESQKEGNATKPQTEAFGVRLPTATIQRLRIQGIREKRHVSDLITEALGLWWEQRGHLAKFGPLDAPEEP